MIFPLSMKIVHSFYVDCWCWLKNKTKRFDWRQFWLSFMVHKCWTNDHFVFLCAIVEFSHAFSLALFFLYTYFQFVSILHIWQLIRFMIHSIYGLFYGWMGHNLYSCSLKYIYVDLLLLIFENHNRIHWIAKWNIEWNFYWYYFWLDNIFCSVWIRLRTGKYVWTIYKKPRSNG